MLIAPVPLKPSDLTKSCMAAGSYPAGLLPGVIYPVFLSRIISPDEVLLINFEFSVGNTSCPSLGNLLDGD